MFPAGLDHCVGLPRQPVIAVAKSPHPPEETGCSVVQGAHIAGFVDIWVCVVQVVPAQGLCVLIEQVAERTVLGHDALGRGGMSLLCCCAK